MLAPEEKDRLIELLIEVFNEASDSEGIYFTSGDKAIEILKMMYKMNPSEEIEKQIKFMEKE